jgi:hypothetical protein
MLLPTAMVNLVSRDTIAPVRVLVDSGSDQSYIREEIVQSLAMETKGAAKTMTILMHGGQARNTRVKRASFQLLARNQKTNIAFHAWSVPTVCSPPERPAVNLGRYPHLKGLPLADTDPRSGATIDILIGADQWSRIMKGGIKKVYLVSLLIRFRFHRIGMMADLRKMFLQIKIAPEDQNIHRFLWRDLDSNAEVKEYCMTRLPFGDICSPYEVIATMHHHPDQCKEVYPRAAQVIKEDTYVDDCLAGCETEIMATELYSDLVEMMKIGRFDLLKWATNSKVVLENIPPNQRAVSRVVCLDNYSNPLKALGLSWNTIEDVFFFQQGDKLLQAPFPEPKLSIISISSKLFDPWVFSILILFEQK